MSLLTKKNGKTMLADTVYSVGKKVVMIFLPAVSTLYYTLALIWGIPNPTKVIGSISALNVFLGVLLHISSTQFDASGAAYDGTVHVINSPTGSTVGFHMDPQDLVSKDAVTFKVVPPPLPSGPSDGGSPNPGVPTPQATATTPLPPSQSSTMGLPPPPESSS